MTNPYARALRIVGGLVVTVLVAVGAAIVVEPINGQLHLDSHLSSLIAAVPRGAFVTIAVLLLIALGFGLGGASAWRQHHEGETDAPETNTPDEPPAPPHGELDESPEAVYTRLGILSRGDRELLLAVLRQYITDPSLLLGRIGEQMSEFHGGSEILAFLWTVTDGHFHIESAPLHLPEEQTLTHAPVHLPEEQTLTVPADDSWIVRRTKRWREEAPVAIRNGKVIPDAAMPVLCCDLAGDHEFDDLALLATVGYNALIAVPITLDGRDAWVIALSKVRNIFTADDKGHLRVAGMAFEIAELVNRQPSSLPQPEHKRGWLRRLWNR